MGKDKRIYSIHSQKGGVGKTSVAIAIAGLENLEKGRNVIIVDADLTGTSLDDLWKNGRKRRVKYLNELLLSTPIDFRSNTSTIDKLQSFIFEIDRTSVKYLPSSPLFHDVSQIIPLISQEDHLQFFCCRLKEISQRLFEKFDTIIFDSSPGLFGISKSLIESIGGDAKSWKKNVREKIILVTTSDPNDYLSLIPSFSDISSEFYRKDEKDNIKYKDKIQPIELFVNKAYVSGANPKFDATFVFAEISKVIEDGTKLDGNNRVFKDGSRRKIGKGIWELLSRGQKEDSHDGQNGKGNNTNEPIACEFDPDFRITDIIPSIGSLLAKESKPAKIQDWIKQIQKIIQG